MGGKGILFQKDAYVKYFCTNPETAADYFDRTEVYQSFLSNFENPCEILEDLATRVDALVLEMEEQEYEEMLCRSELASLRGQRAVAASAREKVEQSRTEKVSEYTLLLSELEILLETGKDVKKIASLTAKRRNWRGYWQT